MEKLVDSNSDVYLPNYAILLIGYAELLKLQNNIKDSWIMFVKAYQNYKELVALHPDIYLPYLGLAAINISMIHSKEFLNQKLSFFYLNKAIQSSFPYIDSLEIAQYVIGNAVNILNKWNIEPEEYIQSVLDEMPDQS